MITCKNNFGESVTLPEEKFKSRPSVYGIIRDGNDICICITKSKGKVWFPGGGVEAGESNFDALRREIKEETGLTNVRIGKALGTFENHFYYQPEDGAYHAILSFYECFIDGERPMTNRTDECELEVVEVKWVNLSTVKKDDLNDLNEEIFGMLNNMSMM